MIAVLLALALQVDSPSPSPTATPTSTPRSVPTAKPLPKPTPPYLTAPKGWTRLKSSPRSGPFSGSAGAWERYTELRGNEEILVASGFGGGLSARDVSRVDRQFETMVENTHVVSEHARMLCGGTVPGWESVSRQAPRLGSRTYVVIFAADAHAIYSVRYDWESAYPADPVALASLHSFCPTRERYAPKTAARSAIAPPPTWIASDVSPLYHTKAGSMQLYIGPKAGGLPQEIMVERIDSPAGVDPNVDRDISGMVLQSIGNSSHTIVSKRGIALCDGDGWMVEVHATFYGHGIVDVSVYSFGAPYTYAAVYRRAASTPASPAAIKAIASLCPSKA